MKHFFDSLKVGNIIEVQNDLYQADIFFKHLIQGNMSVCLKAVDINGYVYCSINSFVSLIGYT